MTNEELWEALVDFMSGANARFATINRRLDALSARADLLQPRQRDMVECPACHDGLAFTPGDADDPASHDRCELCGGRGEVPEGVAAYAGRMERLASTLSRERAEWRYSSDYWMERFNKEVAHRKETGSQAVVVDALSKSRPGAGLGASMGREA